MRCGASVEHCERKTAYAAYSSCVRTRSSPAAAAASRAACARVSLAALASCTAFRPHSGRIQALPLMRSRGGGCIRCGGTCMHSMHARNACRDCEFGGAQACEHRSTQHASWCGHKLTTTLKQNESGRKRPCRTSMPVLEHLRIPPLQRFVCDASDARQGM